MTLPSSGTKPEIVLIAAVAENGVIGKDDAMPWRLKSDLQRFKQLTLGKPVIMGRKTFASIGKPLPGRTNIVVTRDRDFRAPGCVVATSFDEALAIAQGDAMRRLVTEIAVIGGGEVYAHFLAQADRLEITQVHATPDGDARFPAIEPSIWREEARTRHDAGPGDSAAISYVTYRRHRQE